jgi:hypothetical protein
MMTYGGSVGIASPFLTSRLGRFTPGETAPSTHWIGSWVGPKADLKVVEKIKILPLPVFKPQPSSP